MENGKYFLVEHDITDKQGWDGWMASWSDIFGAEDMTVDKARAVSEYEGNECVLTIPTTDGKMTICLWKMPNGTSLDEFQAFTDRFCCFSTNKVFEVEHTLGTSKLDVRGYLSDFINAAQGRQSPGYLDAPMLWMTHHHVLDLQGWDKDVNARIADQISKTCTTPSDCQNIHPTGHKCCLTIFCASNDTVCFVSTPEGFTQEDVRKAEDEFTRGLSRNYAYKLDTAKGLNAFHLSEDNWSQDAMNWANSRVKTMPLDSTTTTMTTPVGIEASQ